MKKNTYYKNLTLPENKTELLASDGEGLSLRVRSGKKGITKNWLFTFTSPLTKKQTKMSLGKYPALSLAEARRKTYALNEMIANDLDPKVKVEIANIMTDGKVTESNFDEMHDYLNQSFTFKQVAELFLVKREREDQISIDNEIKEARKEADEQGRAVSESVLKDIKSKRRATQDIKSRLDNYLLPKLGKMPIKKIEKPLVVKVLEPIEKRGNLETVKRCCQIVRQIAEFAETKGYISSKEYANFITLNNAFSKPKSSNQLTVNPERLGEVMEKMGNSNIQITTRAAFELMLHLLSRTGEISKLRWDEYNETEGIIKIGGYRMKGNNSHIIPLSPQAKAILDYMHPITGDSEYVFPSCKPGGKKPYMNPQTVNMAMKRSGLGGTIVAHGLRSVGSTTLNDCQKFGHIERFDPEQVELCLAHMDKNSVRFIYNGAEYVEKRREILSWWSDFILKQTGNFYSLAGQVSVRK
ncbi:hypothetical protein BCT41_08690 [Vibrio splendidus]|uniref:tyrosine-type recombinase/integrase n=1 Tax=Vibrio splendidus TaxID=29497 RepID=UPI000C84E0E1|nr:integrase arm-type DNA-binding domain-containing protein [Vibrio splendidus]PMN03363.1 hypothetical protein BCT41_08690 [Vibrio splendidus]